MRNRICSSDAIPKSRSKGSQGRTKVEGVSGSLEQRGENICPSWPGGTEDKQEETDENNVILPSRL